MPIWPCSATASTSGWCTPTTPTTRIRCSRARASPRCAAAASSCASTTWIPTRPSAAALKHGYEVLEPATDKPHGLREAYILDGDGYVWVPDIASLSKWSV